MEVDYKGKVQEEGSVFDTLAKWEIDGYDVGVGKPIRKEYDLFFTRTSFEVDNGRRVEF